MEYFRVRLLIYFERKINYINAKVSVKPFLKVCGF